MRITTLPEEDQHALGRELAALAVAMGPTWLLDAPILLPRPADFPDQWRPDLDGAELMLERLLTCAGLGEEPFTIDAYENDEALQAMAFALGLQVRLRLAEGRTVELRAIREGLEPAQRETFEATLTLGEVETRALVPIPPAERWRPVTLPHRPPAQALPKLEAHAEDPGAAPETVIAFRVRQRRAFSLTSLMGTLIIGSAATALWPPWGLALFLVVPALVAMRRRAALECSACEAAIGADAQHCTRCGARLVDTIETRNDRFDAEDRWRKAHGAEHPAA